jgi:hypothetical protein
MNNDCNSKEIDFLDEDPFSELFEIDPPAIEENVFSFFDPPVYNVNPCRCTTLSQVFEMLTDGSLAEVSEKVKEFF